MKTNNVFIEKNHPAESLASLFWRAHDHARQAVRAALMESNPGEMAKVAGVTAADTIYGIDVIAEAALFKFIEAHQHEAPPFLLIGEFETSEAMTFGTGAPLFRVLLDPIDGTRLLMHQKSSGWILTGIALEKGDATRLSDIFFALQTELPPPKQLYADTLWASFLSAAHALRENLLTGECFTLPLRGDTASDLQHGFVSFVNLFPRGKRWLATLEEEFLFSPGVAPFADSGAIFSDQHLSTGGQLYALMTGQLRVVADLRPLLNLYWRGINEPTVLCAHPYDLAASLIARQAGVILSATDGTPFDGPTDSTAEIGWLGFANQALAQQYLDPLLQLLRQHRLVGSEF